MPDLVTHLAGAYLVKKGIRITRYLAFFYLGALLPDLASRPLHILFPRLNRAAAAYHSPMGVFLICWLVSLFFRQDQRRGVFFLLAGGSLLHGLLDLCQKHLVGGYSWFFPFSRQTFSLGFFWPEDSLRFLPFTIVIVLAVYLWGYLRRKKSNCK